MDITNEPKHNFQRQPAVKKKKIKIHYQNKKFRNYLYDFFMLFLAVTAGFFMENLRERHVEKKKEKIYIEKIISDIKTDTAEIAATLKNNNIQIAGLDSLLDILEAPFNKANNKIIYYHVFNHLNSYQAFSAREITITQLKSSGDFRLIGNKNAADSIVLYYSDFDSYKDQMEFNKLSFQQIVNLEMEILDFGVGRNLNKEFIIHNPEKLKLFYNYVMIAYYIRSADNEWLIYYKALAEAIIGMLQKEYKIKT